MTDNTDVFLVGHQEAAEAVSEQPEIKDSLGNVTQEFVPAQPAKEYKEGVKVTLRSPVPFQVILKALEYWSVDLHSTARAGEVIVRSQVVQNEAWKQVEADGRLMFSLCVSVAATYLMPEEVEQVKKNSPQAPSSNDKKE